jgi:hypothetical protein
VWADSDPEKRSRRKLLKSFFLIREREILESCANYVVKIGIMPIWRIFHSY